MARLALDLLRDLQGVGFAEGQSETILRVVDELIPADLTTKGDLQALRAEMIDRLASLENRIVILENRFGTLENRFGTLENRFVILECSIENRFVNLENSLQHRFGILESNLENRFATLENILEVKMIRLENRVIKWVVVTVVMANLAMVGAVAMIFALIR